MANIILIISLQEDIYATTPIIINVTIGIISHTNFFLLDESIICRHGDIITKKKRRMAMIE